jgi:hypothetical protein
MTSNSTITVPSNTMAHTPNTARCTGFHLDRCHQGGGGGKGGSGELPNPRPMASGSRTAAHAEERRTLAVRIAVIARAGHARCRALPAAAGRARRG